MSFKPQSCTASAAAARDGPAPPGSSEDLLYFYSRDGGATVHVSFGIAPEEDVPPGDVFAVDFSGDPAPVRLRPFA